MNINQTLKQYFGYDSLRTGQEELINGILAGHDVLGIMPTGAGKSLCYQLPALMLKGITLVISPLISLMSDQVKALNQAGVHAAYINSSLTENQIRMALSYASQGAIQDNLCRSGAPQHAAFSGFCLQRGHIDADS